MTRVQVRKTQVRVAARTTNVRIRRWGRKLDTSDKRVIQNICEPETSDTVMQATDTQDVPRERQEFPVFVPVPL